jgi:hypothetical protein
MSGSLAETVSDLTLLEQNNWIDRQTRAVFVEFDLYNPNVKMFSYCYILFEFLPTGSIVKSYRFYPMTLFDDRIRLYSFGTICAVIYIVMVFVLAMRQVYLMKIHKVSYFKRAWTYLDWTLIAFSFTAFAIWLYRVCEARDVIEKLAQKSQAVSLQMLAYWDDTLVSMLAFCACLGSLKFFKILEFSRGIQTLGRAFKIGFINLAGFLLIFSLLCFAWLQVAFVVFGDRARGFSTLVRTIETGFLLLLGKFQLSDMMQTSPFWAVVFHTTYSFCMVFVMLQMFLTLIAHSLADAKRHVNARDQLGMEEFIYERIESAFQRLKDKLAQASGRKRERGEHERHMRESMARKDLYQDVGDVFASKTNQVLSKFIQLRDVHHKNQQIQKFLKI